VMDWWSRFVLAWELSNTLEAAFCVQGWQLALARGNQPPLIANTDQGAQFTSVDYVGAVQEAGVLVSMDGRGRWMDNRFVERLWRCHRAEQNRPAVSDSKPATLRQGIHIISGFWIKGFSLRVRTSRTG